MNATSDKRVPILIVDDLPDNLLAFETILSNDQYIITSASSGAEAIERTKKIEFAAILMDVNMPNMDGFEAAKFIRKEPLAQLTPIIFVTGMVHDQAHIKRAHSLGAVDFLAKPFDTEILGAKLNIFKDLFQARKDLEEKTQLFDLALSSSPNFHYVYDLDQRFKYVNKTLLDYWNLKLSDVIGKNVIDLGYPSDLVDFYTKQFEKVLETKESVQGSSTNTGSDGKTRHFEFTLTPVLDKSGKITAVSGTTLDVTERMLNERDNFRNLFKQTSEIICILRGPDHLFEFVNEAHAKILGFDATGMTIRQAQPDAYKLHQVLDEVYKTGITVEQTEVASKIRGEIRYFNLTYAARRDTHGLVDGIMVLGLELTKKVKTRLELIESQEQLKFALSSADIGNWHVDLTNNKVKMSEGALHIFGYDAEYKNPDAAIDTFIHPDDREHARQNLLKTLDQKIQYQDEYRIKRSNGEIRWVKLRGRAQFVNKTPVALTGIVMDITDEKFAHEELQRAVSIRDEFISIASHEFRTPVTALRLHTQLLKKIFNGENGAVLDNDRLSKYISVSDRQLILLTRLIEQMLDVSRIGTDKMVYDFRPVDLSMIARNTLQSLQVEIDNIHVAVTFKDGEEVMVNGDRYKLEQVVTNLISNALKYGEYKPIMIEVKKKEAQAILLLRDEGLGIPENMKEKIFGKFERAINSENISGLGLGLYITKEIITAHGGSITVESSLGHGSTFTVTLPLAKA